MSQDNSSDTRTPGEDRVLKNLIVLALPWLALQRDLLAVGQRGIQDYSHVRPLQNFALRELHALMMVLDPSRKWRDSYSDLETKLEESSTQGITKMMSGMSDLLQSQETFLNCVIETLNEMRNGAKTHPAE